MNIESSQKAYQIGIVLLFLLAILFFLHEISSATKNDRSSIIMKIEERAYYKGQMDAMEGDIKIIQVKDTLNDSVKWVWIKSPWDDGRTPLFQP